jgi:hypothetical protein
MNAHKTSAVARSFEVGIELDLNKGEQLEVNKWFSWSSGHFCRYDCELYFENVTRPECGVGERDPEAIKDAARWMRRSAAIAA